MEQDKRQTKGMEQRRMSHMPKDSVFYEKIIPALFVFLGVVMILLVLFAAAVLTGLIHF